MAMSNKLAPGCCCGAGSRVTVANCGCTTTPVTINLTGPGTSSGPYVYNGTNGFTYFDGGAHVINPGGFGWLDTSDPAYLITCGKAINTGQATDVNAQGNYCLCIFQFISGVYQAPSYIVYWPIPFAGNACSPFLMTKSIVYNGATFSTYTISG